MKTARAKAKDRLGADRKKVSEELKSVRSQMHDIWAEKPWPAEDDPRLKELHRQESFLGHQLDEIDLKISRNDRLHWYAWKSWAGFLWMVGWVAVLLHSALDLNWGRATALAALFAMLYKEIENANKAARNALSLVMDQEVRHKAQREHISEPSAQEQYESMLF